MNNKKKYFYLPFASLLVYTFGAFFLFNFNSGGVSLSPGGGTLGNGVSISIVSGILFLVLLMLFFSVKKKNGEKNER